MCSEIQLKFSAWETQTGYTCSQLHTVGPTSLSVNFPVKNELTSTERRCLRDGKTPDTHTAPQLVQRWRRVTTHSRRKKADIIT